MSSQGSQLIQIFLQFGDACGKGFLRTARSLPESGQAHPAEHEEKQCENTEHSQPLFPEEHHQKRDDQNNSDTEAEKSYNFV